LDAVTWLESVIYIIQIAPRSIVSVAANLKIPFAVLVFQRPPGFPFTLNSAVDELLKREFDTYRVKKKGINTCWRQVLMRCPPNIENLRFGGRISRVFPLMTNQPDLLCLAQFMTFGWGERRAISRVRLQGDREKWGSEPGCSLAGFI